MARPGSGRVRRVVVSGPMFADAALTTTIVSLLIWVVFFPVLVQGLIIYAVILARGEKRANDEYRARHET